jgi:membrane-bound ClpP family serine protease
LFDSREPNDPVELLPPWFEAMDPAYLAVALLVLGLALIVCEVFIPSAGLIAIFATLCFAGSIALLALIPSAISGAFYLLPRTEFGKQVLLEAPDLEEVTPYQEERRQLERLVGKIGQTLTLLNPGGLVQVDGTRQHCESEGILLEAGTAVEIVAIKGNRVVVRPVERHANPPGNDANHPVADAEAPLDFDLPQS